MRDARIVLAVALAVLSCLAPGTGRAADDQKPAAVRVPDGVQASPVASVMVVHADAQCPAMASFRRDSISYTERANNRVVSNWTNASETFVACVDADPNAPDPNTLDPNGAETPP